MHRWLCRIACVGVFAVALLGCVSPAGWIGTATVPLEELRALRPPSGAPDLGAIVVLDEGSMEVFSGGEMGFSVFDRRRIIKIFNPSGHRYANIMIPYGSSSSVTEIHARTITPAGETVELRTEDIYDVSLYPNFVFFSDQRARIFTLPAIENGSIIEYQYRLRINNRGLWHAWNFQDEVPVHRSRFTLVKPGEWKILYRTYGRDIQPIITNAPAGFKSRHVWETTYLPPLDPEFGMPAPQEVMTRLALAPVGFTGWSDLSSWYYDIADPYMDGGSLVATLADSLTGKHQQPYDKLKAVFEWVRDHVRYIAIEIGVGGYQPHEAEDIVAKRYGDCKDMVIAVCALARRAGVRVLPVLISTQQNGRADTTLPTPLQFNHLIAYAPDIQPGGIWMDATEKACRFTRLPWYDQGCAVVVASQPGDSTRAVTPMDPPAENGLQVEWTAALREDGSASIAAINVLTGAVATELRHELRSANNNDRRKWLESFLSRRAPLVTVDSFTIRGLDPSTDSLIVAYRFRSASFASRSGATMILRPGEIIGSTLSDYFRAPSRIYPVRFRFGSQSDLRLTVHLPENWEAGETAGGDSMRSEYGTWYARRTVQGNTIQLTSGYSVNGADIPPARYPPFQRFLDSTRVRNQHEWILTRKP